jgi:predicted CXXCH cytochrome family protein
MKTITKRSQKPEAGSRKNSAGYSPHLVTLSPLHLVIIFIATLPLIANPAWAQTAVPATTPVLKAAKPTTAVPEAGCVTPACHVGVKQYKVLHGPVNVNACTACHKPLDPAQHTFALTREKKDLCTFCHKIETAGMAVVHKPVQTGECLACHDPHGGKTPKFIRGTAMNELCKQCHKDVIGGKKFLHGPVAAGACQACHKPHASPNKKLLVAEGKALCLTCHKEMGDQLKQVKVVHKPVAEGECSQCHDPHASDYAMQIKKPAFELCTGCHQHDPIRKAATESAHKHSIVTTGKACLNCHTPHGGNLAKLFKTEPVKICMTCHDQKQIAPDGRTVPAVSEILDAKLFRHGPARDGNCGGCHNVHGSDVTRLLAKPYPEQFYQPFSVDKYDLCFSCHDKQLVLLEKTEGLTGFRNGDRNLHFVHVNRADKGRTCRACHEPHASKLPVHLRESVPFGQWELPINYNKTASGGSCAPGCHQALAYDRQNAIEKPATPEFAGSTPPAGTQPAATQAAATQPATTQPGPAAAAPAVTQRHLELGQ